MKWTRNHLAVHKINYKGSRTRNTTWNPRRFRQRHDGPPLEQEEVLKSVGLNRWAPTEQTSTSARLNPGLVLVDDLGLTLDRMDAEGCNPAAVAKPAPELSSLGTP